MRKVKLSEKLALNKKTISNIQSTRLIGAGPTFQITCHSECISIGAYDPRNACGNPIHSEQIGCRETLGC